MVGWYRSMDGDLIRQVFQGTVLVQVVAQDIGKWKQR